MSIFIYRDEGASTDCVEALMSYYQSRAQCVTGAELQSPTWIDKTRVLIMPGGRSLPYYQTLGKSGNQLIKTFVEKGGCYIGICAGAYYACRETIFAKETPLELLLPGELNFFGGKAIGPAFTDKPFGYGSESGAQWVDVTLYNQQTQSFYFNGGCYFDGLENLANVTVLGRYQKTQLPAIIKVRVGKGIVFLFGVHPEIKK